MSYRLLLLLFVGCCAACSKAPVRVDNLSGGRVYVIGHGGSGLPGLNNPYPLDSWQGVTRAIEYYNADGVEMDLKLSADTVLFLWHDMTLDAASYCSGCLYTYDSAQLSQCAFRPATVAAGSERMYPAAFEQVIARFAQRKVSPLVFADLHPLLSCNVPDSDGYRYQVLLQLKAIIARYQAADWLLLQSPDRAWLDLAAGVLPDTRLLLDDAAIDDESIDYAAAAGYYGIAGKNNEISREEMARAHSLGLRVQIYGANSQNDLADALNKSPDYLLTDNIRLLQQMVP